MVPKIRRASAEAGRAEDAVHIAGYLFSLVDETRREALNRAKREPFVIYMMAIQTDVALKRAGLDLELRDRVFQLWRAEDYHAAAQLIPDDMLDAFLLCGSRDDVAERVWRYREAGMHLPILQPVVQNEDQVDELLAVALRYGSETSAPRAAAPAAVDAAATVGAPLRGPLSLGVRVRRRVGAYYEIIRPFSFTASTVPVAAAGSLAAINGLFSWSLFIGALLGSVLLHIGTNITNEIYDVRQGVDKITSPRASHALLKGRLTEREAFALALLAFLAATGIGVWLFVERGWPVIALGVIGLLGGWGYTAPPLQYKFRALGLPLVFVLFGPISVVGSYFVVTGEFAWAALWTSIPVGFLVTAILHGNEWRDISEDARSGGTTFSIKAGRKIAHAGYLWLVIGAYIALGLSVVFKELPVQSLLALLSLPLLVRVIRDSELGAQGQQRAIAKIDIETAQLHAAFGFLLVLGLGIAAAQ
jgi:1,4-dihydroxy-2-naphthoate octaprenyltransferase